MDSAVGMISGLSSGQLWPTYRSICEVILIGVIEALGYASLVTLVIVPFANGSVHQNQDSAENSTDNDHDKPWGITRRVFGVEYKRTCEVSYVELVKCMNDQPGV